MENTANKIALQFSKAESELDSIAFKVDQEYSALAAASNSQIQGDVKLTETAKNVQNLRNELKKVSQEVLNLQKEQQEVMSTVQAQLTEICGKFDDLENIVAPEGLQD